MNGIHDMGGMHGFGPVVREAHEPTFHAPWEAEVRAMMGLTIGKGIYNLDEFRYGIEQMPPVGYLEASYYERWLAAVEYNLVLKGVLTRDELEARVVAYEQEPPAAAKDASDRANRRLPRYGHSPRCTLEPRFAVGERVITRNTHPHGHTRLPRYARGKRGAIQLVHGPQIFADTNAHALGDDQQVVYNVRFDAVELWGSDAEPEQAVHIDLWESYLEPAPD